MKKTGLSGNYYYFPLSCNDCRITLLSSHDFSARHLFYICLLYLRFGALWHWQLSLFTDRFLQKSLVPLLPHPVQATCEGFFKLELRILNHFGVWCYTGAITWPVFEPETPQAILLFFWRPKRRFGKLPGLLLCFRKESEEWRTSSLFCSTRNYRLLSAEKTVIFVWQCAKLWSPF